MSGSLESVKIRNLNHKKIDISNQRKYVERMSRKIVRAREVKNAEGACKVIFQMIG